MILGGSRYILPVIKAAHNLGVYVITCDYLPNNIAHKYSDEYCYVSIIDKEAVLKKAREYQIDGITSFACDPGVITAAYVAEEMNLPSGCSYKAACILQNKKLFRSFLKEHGFSVPIANGYSCIDDALKDTSLFHWPVIVKPTDSAGSKGVSRVDSPENLEKAIEYALLFSRSKEFIIEDFIIPHGYSSDTDSFSIDGELKFVSFNSQMFDIDADNPYTPAAYSWPSSISQEHQSELSVEIQRLIHLLGLGTSIYNIETREGIDGKAYIMEMSPRGGGNRLAECIEYATGVKLIENTVRAALGFPLIDVNQVSFNGYWAEVILHSEEDGYFKKCHISDRIQRNIIDFDLWINPGDEVKSFKSANFAIGTIILRFDNASQLREAMSDINQFIKIEI